MANSVCVTVKLRIGLANLWASFFKSKYVNENLLWMKMPDVWKLKVVLTRLFWAPLLVMTVLSCPTQLLMQCLEMWGLYYHVRWYKIRRTSAENSFSCFSIILVSENSIWYLLCGTVPTLLTRMTAFHYMGNGCFTVIMLSGHRKLGR